MSTLTYPQIADLVIKAQKGDAEAFAALYTATVDRQLYFATAFLRDAALAEDVVQDVYIKMFKSLGKLKNPNVFVAYLNRICYNTCIDYKKKFYMQKFELNEDKLSRIEDPDTESAPEEHFATKETNNNLLEALDKLSEQERSAFLLRHYQNLKIKDIALMMKVSESTVKRSINSAINTLKPLMSEYDVNTTKGVN